MLFLHRVDRQVADARVFTDEHAGVDRIVGADEKDAAFFERLQRIGRGGARIHRDQRAGRAGGDFASVLAVFLEKVAHDAVTGGEVHQLGFKSDQAARWDHRLDEGASARLGVHVFHETLAVGERLENALGVITRRFDIECLVGFEQLAAFVATVDHHRP